MGRGEDHGHARIPVPDGLVQLCGPAGAPAPGPGRVRAPRAGPPGGHLGAGRIGAAPAADGCGGGDPAGAAHVLSGELAAALAGLAANLAAAWLCCRAEGGALFAGLNLALGCFNLLPVGRLDGGRALHCLLSMSIGPAAEEAEAVLDRVLIAFFAGAGRAPDWLGRQFYPPPGGALAAGKKKEGKKGRNRSCQGLQKRVKWFLHSK